MKNLDDIVNLLEHAGGDDEIAPLVARYADSLRTPRGAEVLVARLDRWRDAARDWKSVVATLENVRRLQFQTVRAQMESATTAVLTAEGLQRLAAVAKEHPIVFTANFLSSMRALYEHATQAGEAYTADLIASRLRSLQLVHLANSHGMSVDDSTLKRVVFQVLEAKSLKDLLDVIGDELVTMAEAFDGVLLHLAKEGSLQSSQLTEVAKLRRAVLQGLRAIVESVVLARPAAGGPEDAVRELTRAQDADQLLQTIARYPFVLGEDFGAVLTRELTIARAENDAKTVEGLERRQSHLAAIGRIVSRLTQTEPAPPSTGGPP